MSQPDDLSIPSTDTSKVTAQARGFGVRQLSRLLGGLRFGRLRVVLPSGTMIERVGSEAGPDAMIKLKSWRAVRRIILGGDIGFAEGYMAGEWTTPDLTELIRLGARNTAALSLAIQGNRLVRLLHRFSHLRNANTKRGSRRNIEAHYDLGNAFYERWLDPSMQYSSAIWDETTNSLEAAQALKLKTIRERLALKGGESVLEIGCGWGSLAESLAVHADAKVTGITLSPSQLEWAKGVAQRSGKADNINLKLEDYRDTKGTFDRIVSIEMFEAVGEAYWPSYFQTIASRLKEGGRAVLQIISIEEDRYHSYRRDTDFIQKYIFPGGFLPSDTALVREINKAGLELKSVEHFGKSYARTLAEWCLRFKAQWPTIGTLGFDQRFERLWEYYLCYCEAGFEEGSINVGLYAIEHQRG